MLRRVITIMTDTQIHLYTGDTQEGGRKVRRDTYGIYVMEPI